MTSVLKTENLTKAFGGLVAVDHVSFAVEAGTVCGLIGPNGSGKSTLINLLTGFYRPDSGSVTVDGVDVTFAQAHTHTYKGIARTFQHTRVYDSLTVEENVIAGCIYKSQSNLFSKICFAPNSVRDFQKNRERANEILKFIGLDDVAHKYAERISHGQQRFLEIARALATRPKVLLLDEPAAGMTNMEIERLQQLLKELKKAGLAVVVIEHNTGLVKEVSDQITVLNFGKKIADGAPDAVLKNPEVVAAYLGGGQFAQN